MNLKLRKRKSKGESEAELPYGLLVSRNMKKIMDLSRKMRPNSLNRSSRSLNKLRHF